MTDNIRRQRLWLAAMFMLSVVMSCHETPLPSTMFTRISANDSQVDFQNKLTVDDDFNIIEYLYFYNGGGVAAGDINNDGLPDLYFSSNQQTNKLYLNKGGLRFEDITDRAEVPGAGNWKTGVTMADVNGDGLLDIFSCGVGGYKKFDGSNRLYINKGDLTFVDSTDAYGLTFQGFSSQAAFFDYDNDGDLDLFLVNHAVHTTRSIGPAMMRFQSDAKSGDKLYRNERVPTGKNFFKEVTSSSGILNSAIGYGLGVAISDLNRDGLMDIYVTNDFHENDYLYMNDGHGNFTERLADFVPHSSRFSMGVDIADINNDGWMDVFSLDMLPRDETVIKTTAGEDSYDIYNFKLGFGYHHQYARNALQLNRGTDQRGNLMFSDIAPLAGIEATDWSWGPVLADFDHDGMMDIFVANGIVGRPNALDYINYISSDSAQRFLSDDELVAKMPDGRVPNFFFRNTGDLQFEDVSSAWIGKESTLSNGATSADLDNDGDLDLIVNNLNEPAGIFRNDHDSLSGAYLKVALEGKAPNTKGIGASVTLVIKGRTFKQEQIPTRGWLSATDQTLHFGLPSTDNIDSVVIRWPDGKEQISLNVRTNQQVVLKYSDTVTVVGKKLVPVPGLFEQQADLPVSHRENYYVAFNEERLIPTSVSSDGPGMAVADVNGDGLEDVYVCGGAGQSGMLYLQDRVGALKLQTLSSFQKDSMAEDIAASFMDADGNGTPDLIVVSGGQQPSREGSLQPRLYLNDGKGGYRRSAHIPDVEVNASCVRTADFDRDGDEDIFIGSNIVPGHYGSPTAQQLWRNTGGRFENVSNELLPAAVSDSAGMVTDALWLDVNADKRLDLVLVGEWMPVTVLVQEESGKFIDVTNDVGLQKSNGWWRSICAADFDSDGDGDLVVGNFGLNSRLRPTATQPIRIYLSDIDNNGSADPIMTYNNQGISYPFISRDQLVKQVPSLKRKYISYANYEHVVIDDLINRDRPLLVKEVYTMATSYFENQNGVFVMKPLPIACQLSSVDALSVLDVDGNGTQDVVMAGNFDAVQPDIGRADASYGAVLLGDGHGGFSSLEPGASGFVVQGQARSIARLSDKQGELKLIVSRNDDRPVVFKLRRSVQHQRSRR